MSRMGSFGAAGAAIGLLFSAATAQSATVYATADTISALWLAAKPGDTIRLYGTFANTKLAYKSGAAITLDATKAVFSDTLVIDHVDGLTVLGGKYGSATGPTKSARAVAVYGGSNISFSKPVLVGDGEGQGISFSDTVNLSVDKGSFTGLGTGIGMSRVANANLTKNAFTKAASDGIQIADSHNVNASYNTCSDGAPAAGAHPDCIQLWSVLGHPVQSDISIMHNTATGPTQGFTSFTPEWGGGLRIQIEYNTVFTNYVQGIACYGCVDSNISYNNVSTMPGAGHMTNINIIGGSNNIVVGNKIGPRPVATTASRFAAVAAFAGNLDATGSIGAVPEPSAWLMLIAGFGVVGMAARRSRGSVTA